MAPRPDQRQPTHLETCASCHTQAWQLPVETAFRQHVIDFKLAEHYARVDPTPGNLTAKAVARDRLRDARNGPPVHADCGGLIERRQLDERQRVIAAKIIE